MKERKTPYSSRLYHLVVKLKLTNPKREQNTKQMNELNTKQRRRKVGKSEGQAVSKKSLEKHVLLLILASNSFKILGQGHSGVKAVLLQSYCKSLVLNPMIKQVIEIRF